MTLRKKRTLSSEVPKYDEDVYTDFLNDKNEQALIDPYAGIPQTVILDDVKILKGELININAEKMLYQKLYSISPPVNVAIYNYNYGTNNTNAPVITATANSWSTLKSWNTTPLCGANLVGYNSVTGEFYPLYSGIWEIETSVGMWLGGATQAGLGGPYGTITGSVNAGVPTTDYNVSFKTDSITFAYLIAVGNKGGSSNEDQQYTANGANAGPSTNQQTRNTHIFLKDVLDLGSNSDLPYSIQVRGRCSTNQHKVASVGYIKFTLLSQRYPLPEIKTPLS